MKIPFVYETSGADIDKSPIKNAWPDIVSNYFIEIVK